MAFSFSKSAVVAAAVFAAVGCGTTGESPTNTSGSSSTGGGAGPTGAARWVEVVSGTTATLNAVWVAGADDAWAVGDGGTILRWDGNEWSPFAGSLPAGVTQADFTGVSGTSANDVWISATVSFDGIVLLHYDGSALSVAVSSDDEPQTYAFFDVFAVAGGAWIADMQRGNGDSGHAYYFDGSALDEHSVGDLRSIGVIEGEVFGGTVSGGMAHFDGAMWQTPTIEDFGIGDGLFDVHGVNADDVWAVGPKKRVHLSGGEWTVAENDFTLQGVWSAAPDDTWAVGNVVEHYDGSSWTRVDVPGFDGTPPYDRTLMDVYGIGANEVWAVGSQGTTLHFSSE